MASIIHLSKLHILILLVFCSCFLHNTYVTSVTLSLDTDKQTLIYMKSQTITQPPDALATWDPNTSPCNWTRVSCGDHGQRVVDVDLSGLGISGPVNPHIGNLSFLRTLQLQENQFQGIIPEAITNLLRLRILNVSFNSIQGAIPANISRCMKLRIVDFMQNKLSGSIPEDLTLLVNLQILNLAGNHLSGSIPPSIGNLSSLLTLKLGTNTLSGPIPGDLSRLVNLKNLDLTINNLTGIVPPSIYNMSSLETLAVAANDLGGDIPYNVGDTLPNLQIFNFCINKFTGTIPGSLHNLTNIRGIRMAHNRLHGTVPPGLGNLPELEMYNIGYNNIVSSQGEGLGFLNSLANSTKLDFLAIDGNGFDGAIPEFIGNLSKKLRMLYMGSNQIFGIIPPSIMQLQGLALLNLSFNSISGEIPSEVGQLEGLQELVLGKNRLTSNIPNSLGNLRKLGKIDLSSNELEGSIPTCFKAFEGLTYMDLSMNKLNGSIPSEVLDLPSLTTILNLSSNSLTGSLPEDIGNLERVVTIDLSNNRLSGNIPNSIKKCKSLEQLIISENSLSGNIPNGLGELNGLTTLDLSSNELSGSIPLNLQNLKDLQFLNLSFNNLEGNVPSNGIFLNLTEWNELDGQHESVVAPVVHCDLKPSNVLLDEDLTAKIGDFGLARMLIDKDQSFSSAHVLKGSMGYIPPEYGMGAKPSTKGDVYSYGIMLIEIFTGKSPTDEMFVGGLSLKTWVQSAFPDNLDQVLDPNMHKEPDEFCSDSESMSFKVQLDCLTTLIGVALSCTNDSPEGRTTITEALRKLKCVRDMFQKHHPSIKVEC
ncbi:putative protein kinase RLK-Pelle-LRR-XII-1 family [Helianthus annuus]|nr:putative protein kinase RLK-Pelle-LRR-XII-1 family [Helianthus annuus]KAJ0516144.1 putative protein kinase RLK-Pelle-LRR-XII-1 family [Helianthus annuus]